MNSALSSFATDALAFSFLFFFGEVVVWKNHSNSRQIKTILKNCALSRA